MANLSDIIHGSSATVGNPVWISGSDASSSASIDFTSGIDSTYDKYVLEFHDLIPATDESELRFRASTDGGSTWLAGTNYTVICMTNEDSNTAGTGLASTSAASWALCSTVAGEQMSNSSSGGASGYVAFWNPSSGTLDMQVMSEILYPTGSTAGLGRTQMGGALNVTTAVDAVQIIMDSGNITSGRFDLYGIKK